MTQMSSNRIFLLYLLVLSKVGAKRSRKLDDVVCNPSDFYYDFTECDPGRGRWRVAIPSSPACEGVNPPIPPKQLDECFKSCEAGHFLNLETVECEQCAPGTYSLGGGLRFDEWDPLPNGFKAQVEKFRSVFSTLGRQYVGLNCSKWGWRPKGDVILSQGGPCVATLLFSAELVKPGSLKFTYQYADDSVLFQFQANSDQCESSREAEGSRWPPLTGEGVWRTEEIALRTGHNIFQWKTMGIDSHRPKPVLIKRIEIDGVGYTSSCLPCPGGTWNDQAAAKECKPCPPNTYTLPHSNATQCFPCKADEYSESGSSSCKKRPVCSASDFYHVNTPCNSLNQTRVIYKWIQPKICIGKLGEQDESPPAPPGDYTECPPCNLGTEYREGRCIPCSGNTFSDGLRSCEECPPNTAPDTSHHLTQWYAWPDNIHETCISPEDTGCNQSPAWQLNGNYVRSGKGHADWVYLVMTLTVAGFRGVGGIVNGQLIEVGRLVFTFEMTCLHDCELLLMQGTSTKNATVIQRWSGNQSRQEFQHSIVKNDSYSFSWAFQKVAWDTVNSEGNLRDDWSDPMAWSRGTTDDETVVKIYNINVTNSMDGGASSCVQCQDGLIYTSSIRNTNHNGSCIPCSPGSIRSTVTERDNNTEKEVVKCLPCPRNSVTVGPFPKNCTSCGPTLISKDGLTCTTDCLIEMGGFSYDLRPLKGFHSVRGRPLFTSSGTQYYHAYNISFCMDSNAKCYKNVSLPRGFEPALENPRVEALICQSTIFPPAVSMGLDPNSYGDAPLPLKPLSTHAGSLGDHLIGVSHSPSLLGLSAAHAIGDHLEFPHQFHFFYSTSEPTPACAKRSTTITFRCRMPATSWSSTNRDGGLEDAGIQIPEKCPDATCDGCNYHFIWETPFACHVCLEDELTIVRGECKDGIQELHYLSSPSSLCLLKNNASWPKTSKCTNHLPFVVEIAIELAIGLTVLLSVLLLCFWRRHRKLEYKYMKLVASGGSRSGRMSNHAGDHDTNERDLLPVAESCALDDELDDDDDEENLYPEDTTESQNYRRAQMKEVSFYNTDKSRIKNLVTKFSVFNRIKALQRKEEASRMEVMNLTDKEALT